MSREGRLPKIPRLNPREVYLGFFMLDSMMKEAGEMKRGFTLLELIVVIIIIGILATLGFTQYTRVIEEGRAAEAKALLGQMRTAQTAYLLENGAYTATIGNLAIGAPTNCTTTHYFLYYTAGTAPGMATGYATRCTGSGRTPNASAEYTITLNYSTGVWGRINGPTA